MTESNEGYRKFKLGFAIFILIFAIGLIIFSIVSFHEIERALFYLILGIAIAAVNIIDIFKNRKRK